MKTGIHPKYNTIKVSCSCGETWESGSTVKEIKLDICSACHPFYTGTQRLIDTAGRVDKFRKRYAKNVVK
jgi:large subunit ribosomal protein L31